MKTKLLYSVFLLFFFITNITYSQEGKADATFNTYDDGLLGDGFDGTVRTVTLQSDGKLIVGGEFSNFNGAITPKLCRLLPDGSKDPSFITGSGFNGIINCSLIQSDGKILVGGSFTSFNGIAADHLLRLNIDGSLDLTFDSSIVENSNAVYSFALQIDGSFIIVGSFSKYNGNTVNRIARIFPNGNLDTSFTTGLGPNALVETVQVQSDGKIIIGGNFTLFNGVACNRVIRLNPSGSVDNTFSIGSGFDNNVKSIAIQANGKIVFGGDFTSFNGIGINRIVRLDKNGLLDATFESGSGFSNGSVSVIKIVNSGEIMVGGSFSASYNGKDVNRLALLNADGTLVSAFDIGKGPASAAVLSVTLDSDLSFYIGGSFSVFDSQNQGRLAKIDSDGALQIGYLTSGVGFDNAVLKVISLADNKTMAFGSFSKFNGKSVARITRLLENGSIDLSFNSAGTGANNLIRAAALQSDGKIVFVGNFTSYNGTLINRICRIFPDGTIDPTFVIGLGFTTQVYAIAIQDDGRIIVGGNFTKFNGVTVDGVVRLLPNGSLDSSFTNVGADGIVEAILIQPDGKILIGGRFSNFSGNAHNKLVRLHTDGSIDSTFSIGTGFDKNVFSLALQSDTKIIVGGSFLTCNGISSKRIVRLNSNGGLDATFVIGSGFSKGEVRTILVQPDNRLLIGGTFNGTYNSKPVMRIVRLTADGIYDNSFNVNLNSTLFNMCFTPDAKLLIAGNFNSVSGITKHRIARLKLCNNSSVWNGASWNNGSPSLGKALTLNGNYDIATTANSCSCTIAAGKTVTIKDSKTLGLTFEYSGLGTLLLENNASLYQSDDEIENTGVIQLKRQTTAIVRDDYSYWSSPVKNQKLIDVSPNTMGDKFFSFNSVKGFWELEIPNNIMKEGMGYIIRGPQDYSTTVATKYQATFTGIPNNGKYFIPIDKNDSSYLIGNPYPSAIDADLFLVANNKIIDGTLYFWTHNTPITNNIYTSNDYAVYNLLGGVGTRKSLNLGTNNTIPNSNIASGQAFFTTTITDKGSVIFNNSMRVVERNTSFFKVKKNKKIKLGEVEKHRVWLNLSNDQGAFKQTLVGYITDATNDYDNAFDGGTFNGNEFIDFYSINNDKNLVIQGRALPFDQTDIVPLGYKSTIAGIYNISIDQKDGLFETQNIYLEDKMLDVVHDLNQSPYSFTTQIGSFDKRFVLRYTDKTLGNNTFDSDDNQLVISKNKRELKIKSQVESIKSITVFDLQGRKVYQNSALNSNTFTTSSISLVNQIAIVKVTLQSGQVISRKINFYQ
ncbi:T9SS sorting signal type C domain-containing protein [Flavobacterium sp. PL12]|uniref:T9SS sorting signal type C domain-containing protein n=1 Tax=Flavobacterium sp. PL12 TaxID=3071718 RepID=UPI00319E08C3